ncbi:MAG TPA: hypothetical protein VM737_03810 [Gemmatimonadota bacterium]|nr:hypothetical protein [Gemmatimonadota bacterium]
MNQHRAVHLFEDIESNFDSEIRSDAENVTIVGGMMKPTEGDSIWDYRFASGMAIRQDMSGFKKLSMPQTTDRTAFPIGAEHPLAEAALVNAMHRLDRQVAPTRLGFRVDGRLGIPFRDAQAGGRLVLQHRGLPRVHGDREPEPRWIVADDDHRPDRHVAPGDNAEKPDQRHPAPHCETKAHIVAVHGIGAAIVIAEEMIRSDLVTVGGFRRRRDRERHLGQDPGLEDSLWTDQRDSGLEKLKPGLQKCAWQRLFAADRDLLFEESKRGGTHRCVVEGRVLVHIIPVKCTS